MAAWNKIILNITVPVILAAAAAGYPALYVRAKETKAVQYLAAGDSIASGYSCDQTEITPYPELVRRQLALNNDKPVTLTNIAKPGMSTEGFNAVKLTDEEVRKQIRQAEIITVTIGANDLIAEFRTASQEVPDLEKGFQNVIANWNYDRFQGSFSSMMDEITSEAKASARILVTNIYIPAGAPGLPDTLNEGAELIIGKMNRIISEQASVYGYHVISLSEAGIGDHVQRDGLHPTQEGQQLIADAILAGLDTMEPGKEETGRTEHSGKVRDEGGGIWNLAAVAGMCVTGILLIVLGVCRGKRREKEDEDTTDGN